MAGSQILLENMETMMIYLYRLFVGLLALVGLAGCIGRGIIDDVRATAIAAETQTTEAVPATDLPTSTPTPSSIVTLLPTSDCFEEFLTNTYESRSIVLETGARDQDLVIPGPDENNQIGPLGIKLTENGESIAAVKFSLSSENRLITIEGIIDSHCQEVRWDNLPRPGERTLQASDFPWVGIYLPERVYTLRFKWGVGNPFIRFDFETNIFTSVPTPTLTPTSTPAGTSTSTPTPIKEAVDVDVPAGEFIMGDGQEGREVHFPFVDNFQIMRTPVTNAQYARCVEAKVCESPINTRWTDPTFADHPVVDISWYQANVYAEWVGGRLPTEAEWEKACRGPDGRRYPWGIQEPTADQEELGNFFGKIGDTAPVGSYPRGVSPYGVLDMAGNVWEWTSTLWGQREQESDFIYPFDPTDGREDSNVEGYRVVRGGTFNGDAYQVRCTTRGRYHSVRNFNHVGFRIVFPSTLTLATP
jgi:formylglycine-generating enzyme required for sulfatase activity